jgi:hypothetical protein
VADCSAGDVVTGDGYAGEVVEVWELTGKV